MYALLAVVSAASPDCITISKSEMERLATEYVEKSVGPGYILVDASLSDGTVFAGRTTPPRWVVIFNWAKRDKHKAIEGHLTVFADPCGKNIRSMSDL
jgi:hypothetical protein